ncbi:hypothetical protein BJX63DRAFT_154643 [Aspergillus granulosus]|uniref:Protein kinase domain-containing protein n=1 Tax=Aspergillus granulosus TaxID=176169 RepID=A0ABR4GRT8_9EURO
MNTPGNRGTLLPFHLPSQAKKSDPASEDNPVNLDKSDQQKPTTPVLSSQVPTTLRKKTGRPQERGEISESTANERGRFPVRPDQGKKLNRESEVWQKYHRFLEADQAGPGIIAHDHTIDHNIVVIKEIRFHASESQRRHLYKVLNEKPTNIVCLTDLFLNPLSVHAVYEPLEISMHHIQATSRRDITEIDLAIIGKELLQGLHYIHSELGIVYGQLNPKNVLLSYHSCHLKLANVACSILKPQQGDYSTDIAAVGRLLVSIKEPGTSGRNPDSLQLECSDDVGELCRTFIQSTRNLSISNLLKHEFLQKFPGVGRMRMFIFRAMECAARHPVNYTT